MNYFQTTSLWYMWISLLTRSISHWTVLEVCYENALYKFTSDIDIAVMQISVIGSFQLLGANFDI